jgi:hypothetical protein
MKKKKRKKPMTAADMVALRNKKYGKEWRKALSVKMVAARKPKV